MEQTSVHMRETKYTLLQAQAFLYFLIRDSQDGHMNINTHLFQFQNPPHKALPAPFTII